MALQNMDHSNNDYTNNLFSASFTLKKYSFYNRKRLHSRLDNLSPAEYYKRYKVEKNVQTNELGTHILAK